MIEIVPAMCLVNLDRIDSFIGANQRNRQVYQATSNYVPGISGGPVIKQNATTSVFGLGSGRRLSDILRHITQALYSENVLAGQYPWLGCHNMQLYRKLYPRVGPLLLDTEEVAGWVVVLPAGVGMDEEMINDVAAVSRAAAGR